jgi:rod shape-determining protein MreB and related proteins
MIGERTAEDIKIKIGSVYPLEEELKMEVKGRDLVAGLPKTVALTSEEVRESMSEPIAQILEAVRITLERTPPELSSDLIEKGIVLAGGGSLLRGMDKLISEETGLPVHLSEDPTTAVALGTGKVLSEIKYLKKVTVTPRLER